MEKVTKLILINLLGETRAEEKSRIIKEKSKLILAGKPREEVMQVKRGGKYYLLGTTEFQRVRREKLLNNII